MKSHSNEWRDQNYVKIGEIAEKLGVSRSTIYKWVEEKNFPSPVVFGDAKLMPKVYILGNKLISHLVWFCQ